MIRGTVTGLATLPQRVAWVPGAPVLVPELASGSIVEVAQVRDAVRDVLSGVMDGIGSALIVGAGAGFYEPGTCGSFAGLGRDVPVQLASTTTGYEIRRRPLARAMPLPLLVGAHLLSEVLEPGTADVWALGTDWGIPAEPIGDRDTPWALIVVADGSTRRTPGAPGSFHPEAHAWDAALAGALAAGDASALAGVNIPQSARVGCRDVAVWKWAGAALSGSWSADLRLHEAPLGVGYLAASWSAQS